MSDTESESGGEPGPGRRGHWELPGSVLLLSTSLLVLAPSALFLLAFGCLVLSFVFTLFESALLHYSSARLMAEAKRRGIEEQMAAALRNEDETILASKIGRGFTQIAGIALFVVGLQEAQPSWGLFALWSAIALILFLLLLVALPYFLARRAGHTVLLHGLFAYRLAVAVFRPLASLLHRIAGVNGQAQDRAEEITDEILSAVEEGDREGVLEEAERQMIEGVIDLREVAVDHIMTPRTEMISIPVEQTVKEAVKVSTEHGLSRLPAYRGTPDKIVGVLYMKDLLPCIASQEDLPALGSVLRPPFFIPETKNVVDLLNEMKASHVHMAIVLDEYGGTAGVVTIEDILEEIVGEIQDEHEREETHDVVRINENAATVDGRTHIDDLNEALEIAVPESEEYETVGGLLFTAMGRVPAVGEHIDLDKVRFTILEADERRVSRVKVTVLRAG